MNPEKDQEERLSQAILAEDFREDKGRRGLSQRLPGRGRPRGPGGGRVGYREADLWTRDPRGQEEGRGYHRLIWRGPPDEDRRRGLSDKAVMIPARTPRGTQEEEAISQAEDPERRTQEERLSEAYQLARNPEQERRRKRLSERYPGEDTRKPEAEAIMRLSWRGPPRGGPGGRGSIREDQRGEAITGYLAAEEPERTQEEKLSRASSWRGMSVRREEERLSRRLSDGEDPERTRRRGYQRLSLWRGPPRGPGGVRSIRGILARTPERTTGGEAISSYPARRISAILAEDDAERRQRGRANHQDYLAGGTPRGPGERLSTGLSWARTPERTRRKRLFSRLTPRRGRGPRRTGGEAIRGYPVASDRPERNAARRGSITGYLWRGPREDLGRMRLSQAILARTREDQEGEGYQRLSWRWIRRGRQLSLARTPERTRRRGYHSLSWPRTPRGTQEEEAITGYPWRGLRETKEEGFNLGSAIGEDLPKRT
ncbi:hypothetical protein C7M84_003393 [Penaeus vannamei]|uniref:Uncharacterized protein n=1 Tax=Penaeus vannamei TaxID=6689 RepID=A0A3R7N5M3_PENVA|nr:hypothetical protein C7M84_003393 [Penaeus vannamei]